MHSKNLAVVAVLAHIEGSAAQEQSTALQGQVIQIINQIRQLNEEIQQIQMESQQGLIPPDEAQEQIDLLTSQSQSQLIQLQSLISNQNQVFDLLSTFLASSSDLRDQIIGNIR
ncbi:MAG: hypothetical protein ACM3X1_04025 [Ignavibacteriales bacterium]